MTAAQTSIMITKLLWEIGIPMHVHGYHYLTYALQLTTNQTETSVNLSHQLYPCIAQHFHTTPSSVERSIRHAIELAWKRGKFTEVKQLFGRSLNLMYEKPTNGEMIALLTERIRLDQYEVALSEDPKRAAHV